jgi:SNF2 family DNA or RNA helicase
MEGGAFLESARTHFAMIVLHAGVLDHNFYIWGETSLETECLPRRNRRGQGNLKNPGRSPELYLYNAGTTELWSALRETGLSFKVSKRCAESLILQLPTVNNQPIPSSPLIADPPDPKGEAILLPWKVSALRLSREQAVEFICACMGKQVLAPGVVIGKDLAFWGQALRFAASLLTRQQFLPGLAEENGKVWARWKSVLHGPDADRLAALARAMPPVARAVMEDGKSQRNAPDAPAAPFSISVLTSFIEGIVDHLVRSADRSMDISRPKGFPEDFESFHDRWLYSLRMGDGAMAGDPAELAGLAGQIKEWQRPLVTSAASPFRLCFRLEEPDGNGGLKEKTGPGMSSWYVRYLLQAAQDPSLLIPAEKAWKTSSFLLKDSFDSREYLFLSLGQASGICPRIEASLAKPAPAGYELDAAGAHDFLIQKALALRQAGYGVMLPAWWTGLGTKVRLTARASVQAPRMQGAAGLSLDEIVKFDWEVALGEEKLSFEELQALARLKVPLVKLRGQWVQVNAEEIEAALALWKKKGQGQATAREILQMALGGTRISGQIPIDGLHATGWISDLLAELEGKTPFEEIPAPAEFQGTLRPYQVRGYSWLAFLRKWGLGACLADDMGLGKTIQALALIQRDWHAGVKRPVLLVCPTTVVNNWRKEAARFTPDLPVMVHHGIARMRGEDFRHEALKQAIVISSYALLHRDYEPLKDIPWSGIVLDEAQNIKNPETKQARAARGFRADYRLALTGTPVENNVGDLWSIMEFLNPGFLGTQAAFKRGFFIPIQAARDPEAMDRLKRLTGPFILRRLKTDKKVIADLPEKMEMKVFCSLTKEQVSLYEAVVKETMKTLDQAEGIQRKGAVLATLSKLKQVCNHPAQFLGDNSPLPGRSGKLARLAEMVEEMIAVGDRTLVFSQFAEMGEILRRYLQETFGQEVLFLHGAVPKAKRDHMVDRFQGEEKGPSIFILSLKAGGTGLNLTRASHVVHFDRWWNPAVENQATDRAFRIGQTKNVQVHKFLCAGTLEEKIDEMIERKKGIAEKVIGTGEGWLTELSTAELKDLFSLRREAVGNGE